MNIAFFGASVTKQKARYTHYFKQLTNFNVTTYGYGGMQIHNAGLVYITEITKNKFDYCFIDWFTPAGLYYYNKNNLFEYLDTIVLHLLKINCIPVFLFFRGKGHHETFEDKIKIFDLIISEYCNTKHIPYIEVYKHYNICNKADEEILRDNIHTNDVGSELYAKAIIEEFNLKILNKWDYKSIINPTETKYTNISSLSFKQRVDTGICIKGNAQLIGISQELGPFSCYCDIYIDEDVSVTKRERIIDHACYYIRPSIQFSYTFKKQLIIKISSEEINLNSLLKEEVNWVSYGKENPVPPQKQMRLDTIYYIGEINDIQII